jgi:hypothetical protein
MNKARSSRELPIPNWTSLLRSADFVEDKESKTFKLDLTFSESLTERQKEIVFEIAAKDLLGFFGAHSCGADKARMAKAKANHAKAYYGKLRHSEEGRRAFDFLRAWQNAAIFARESGRTVDQRKQIDLLAPLLDALNKFDPRFFKNLAQAIEILEGRIKSAAKAQKSGGRDLHLEKWLIEYSIQIGVVAQHTARELNEHFVSKFRSISDHKLREKCRGLDIPLKPDARGTKAVRYRQMGPSRSKKRPN